MAINRVPFDTDYWATCDPAATKQSWWLKSRKIRLLSPEVIMASKVILGIFDRISVAGCSTLTSVLYWICKNHAPEAIVMAGTDLCWKERRYFDGEGPKRRIRKIVNRYGDKVNTDTVFQGENRYIQELAGKNKKTTFIQLGMAEIGNCLSSEELDKEYFHGDV